jgi:hypothetical protein
LTLTVLQIVWEDSLILEERLKYSIFILFFSIGAAFWSGEVVSQTARYSIAQDPAWLIAANRRAFKVTKQDQVTDGWWTSTADSLNRIKLEILRSGGTIEGDYFLGPNVVASAVGYEVSPGNCVVMVQVRVTTLGLRQFSANGVELDALFERYFWLGSVLLSGPKLDMSRRVAETHEALIRDFLVDLDTNAQAFKAKAKTIMTEADYSSWGALYDK